MNDAQIVIDTQELLRNTAAKYGASATFRMLELALTSVMTIEQQAQFLKAAEKRQLIETL